MGQHTSQPFSPFGDALKNLREKSAKSQAEVSGAVEIAQDQLSMYESGQARPTEDILFLLIQHFDLQGTEAEELWRLAGYVKQSTNDAQFFINDEHGGVKETHNVIVSEDDSKIIYTDMIQVMVNKYGVILNFMQGAGASNQPLAVSRVGMSKEHAKSIVEVLKKTLERADDLSRQLPAEQKHLPSSNQKKG